MRVGVIGAGPAGMTAAYELAKKGIQVEVFEAESTAGGMAKSIHLWGQRVDLGPHRFFSSDRRVNELWLEVVGRDYEIVNRLTRIFYKKNFYAYPLKPLNALTNLGFLESFLCMLSYGREFICPTPEDGSFENWVVHRFGRRLFEIFFKTYSEKLWGVSCKELDADFASQRIKKLSLFEAIRNAFFGNSGNKHKTLVDQFAYPLGGTGIVYERMAAYVESHGGKMHYRTLVECVISENQRVVGLQLKNGEKKFFDHVVSSMPLTVLVKTLKNVPASVLQAASSLRFRNTILVYLRIPGQDLFPDQWIYVHSSELKTGRITNFRNWFSKTSDQCDASTIAMEYWCNDEDALWTKTDDELIALAQREIKSIGLKAVRYLNDAEKILVAQKLISPQFSLDLANKEKHFKVLDGHVHRIKRCYPVYSKGYKEYLAPIESYLKGVEGLTVIGRYGSFKYNNQDHSIIMGLLAAENIVLGAGHDLWKINTDYDTYQESTVITKTGLNVLSK